MVLRPPELYNTYVNICQAIGKEPADLDAIRRQYERIGLSGDRDFGDWPRILAPHREIRPRPSAAGPSCDRREYTFPRNTCVLNSTIVARPGRDQGGLHIVLNSVAPSGWTFYHNLALTGRAGTVRWLPGLARPKIRARCHRSHRRLRNPQPKHVEFPIHRKTPRTTARAPRSGATSSSNRTDIGNRRPILRRPRLRRPGRSQGRRAGGRLCSWKFGCALEFPAQAMRGIEMRRPTNASMDNGLPVQCLSERDFLFPDADEKYVPEVLAYIQSTDFGTFAKWTKCLAEGWRGLPPHPMGMGGAAKAQRSRRGRHAGNFRRIAMLSAVKSCCG